MIRGYDPSEPFGEEVNPTPKETILDGSAKVVVVLDTTDLQDMVLVGINANDRPGLLLDISRGLHSLGLQLHHTEAAVIQNRSVSIWRCEVRNNAHSDSDEIWSVLSALLEKEGSVEAIKRGGLSVIRTIVTEQSRLCGKVLEEVPFRELYKAAVIAVQKFDKSEVDDLPLVIIAPGDILVLQVIFNQRLNVYPFFCLFLCCKMTLPKGLSLMILSFSASYQTYSGKRGQPTFGSPAAWILLSTFTPKTI